MGTDKVVAQIAGLKARLTTESPEAERVVNAFAGFAAFWERRIKEGWLPPDGSLFPWAQVRLSLEALLPGFRDTGAWLARAGDRGEGGAVVALVLAGNTPLLAWPALTAALLAGHAVFVKMSRDETLWTPLFVEALAEVDPDLAALIHVDVWPGDDDRTRALVASADAVIAYGSDASISSLRAATPLGKLFLGFGHALSIGLHSGDWPVADILSGFARDVLMYDQGGCLSPHTLFVKAEAEPIREALAKALAEQAEILDVQPVTDAAVARAVREARDMALFSGAEATGDAALRWTVITYPKQGVIPLPVGHSVISLVSVQDAESIPALLGAAKGRLSSVGLAGEITPALRAAFEAEGVTYFCRPGKMQTPPLDWPNGGVDLLAELLTYRDTRR